MTSRLLMTLIAALLSGCLALLAVWLRPSSDARPAESARSPNAQPDARAAATDPLPAPSGETILRVAGVARGNVSPRATEIDFATLDGLARQHVTVREPFLKRDLRFTGMRMSELLARAGVAQSARVLSLHALDDYHVDLQIAEVASAGFLAIRADGKPIAIADGGPIRLVFTSDRGIGANTDNWIWSIDSMRASR